MRYDLVFEGGGAKGMVFVGAYEEFVKRGHTHGRLLGTSAGAITAVLLAAGYTATEMLDALNEQENGKPVFSAFMGTPKSFTDNEVRNSAMRKFLHDIDLKILPDFLEKKVDEAIAQCLAQNQNTRHFFAFVERGGWYGAERFVSWLQAKLDSGTWKGRKREFSGMTLAQLFSATGTELSVVASDTTHSRLLVLNRHTAPDCPVVWAVRMSMSIPFVWNEVIWEEKWGRYLEEDIVNHAVVDGGVLSNFPIELFISDEPQVTRLMGPKGQDPVLGLLIDESLPVPPTPAARGLLIDIHVKPSELKTVQRLRRLIDTATTAHDKMVIEEFENLVVRLPAQGYGTTEFEMSDERRSTLVEAGRQAMADYLDRPGATRGAAARGMEDSRAEKAGRTAARIAKDILGI